MKVITFPTWSKPGSSCNTDDELIVSVRDQYCNMETGNWHQTIYPKGDCDDVPWWLSWIFPQDQTYTSDSCTFGLDEHGAIGISLKSCSLGPCESNEDDLDTEIAVYTYGRQLRG